MATRTHRLNLRLTDLQERVLLEALNTYIHLMIGNLENAVDPLVMHLSSEETPIGPSEAFRATGDLVRDGARLLQVELTGIPHGGPSIGHRDVSDRARVARRLEALVNGESSPLSLYSPDGKVLR